MWDKAMCLHVRLYTDTDGFITHTRTDTERYVTSSQIRNLCTLTLTYLLQSGTLPRRSRVW